MKADEGGLRTLVGIRLGRRRCRCKVSDERARTAAASMALDLRGEDGQPSSIGPT